MRLTMRWFCLGQIICIFIIGCGSLDHKRGENADRLVQHFEARYQPAKDCADKKIKMRKNQEGEITLQWIVNNKGNVIKPTVLSNSFEDPGIGECFLSFLTPLNFPTSGMFTQTTINYTFRWTSIGLPQKSD